MDYVAEAIAFSLTEKDAQFTLEWSRGITKRAAQLETRATGELRAFKLGTRVYPGNGQQVTELLPSGIRPPSAITLLANDAWKWLDGHKNQERAFRIIESARVEFARARFHWLLWYSRMASDPWFHPRQPLERSTIHGELGRVNWADADAVTRTPFVDYWADDSNAVKFREWCAACDQNEVFDYQSRQPAGLVEPAISAAEMSAGLALTWIDEAVFTPEAGMALLAEAAQALRDVGSLQGWDGHEDMMEQDASHAARARAKKRHEPHRLMREKAIQHYLNGSFPSKDAAAAAIAGNVVPVTFRTVRSWLTGDLRAAPHDVQPAT